jgi:hypothetical protein
VAVPLTYTVGASGGAVDVHRRRIIGMHGENVGVAELCKDHAPQVSIDFADAVVDARRGHAVATIGSRGMPTKWSPSSTVKTNRVFFLVIPSEASRSKNFSKA